MRSHPRRQAMRALALSAGACGTAAVLARGAFEEETSRLQPPFPWPYSPLEPAEAARSAYARYAKGHCMYAVFGSIVGTLGERHGEPYTSFPLEMMVYGLGGVAGWGSLCGALNGAAAAIALFVGGNAERDRVTRLLLRWHEVTPLPIFRPDPSANRLRLPSSVAGSTLCHVSSTRWCATAQKPFFSAERYERCRRLSADTAARTVELLNAWKAGRLDASEEQSPVTAGCLSCHTGEAARGTTFGSLECGTCHSVGESHPPVAEVKP